MNDDDVKVTTDDTGKFEDFPRVRAAERTEELAHLRTELANGRIISADDVAEALHRLEEAHMSAHRAYMAAAEQHRRAAETHQRAADTHAAAAATGKGDVEAHQRAAQVHRAAGETEYRQAEKALELAEHEADYARSIWSKTP